VSVRALGAELRLFHRTVSVSTQDAERLHDLTDDAQDFVAACGVEAGLFVAQSLHTTAGLLLNERETGLQADLRQIAEELVPRQRRYRHDDMSLRYENLCPEDFDAPNGHAHLQHAIFGSPVLTLPVAAGRIIRGRWQRLLLVEYDRPRERTVYMQVLGLPAPS
jgi:secondary thiamine-phosphate synthase enzyme